VNDQAILLHAKRQLTYKVFRVLPHQHQVVGVDFDEISHEQISTKLADSLFDL
jgi:bifunctional ADP-heptose synthase (sugar kinase/adenylyltransferase)